MGAGQPRLRDGRTFGARSALICLVLAVAVACSLNPQPEVPSIGTGGATGAGGVGTGGKGGLGGSSSGGTVGIGGNGTGGTSGGGGAAGGGAGGAGGSGGTPTGACIPDCAQGYLCADGKCVTDICAQNSCASNQACKPNADFTAANCVDTCAGVSCSAGETCVDGQCVATGCSSGCASGESCQGDADAGYACAPNPCLTDAAPACNAYEMCEPATGTCTVDPCIGVQCPAGQVCDAGECQYSGDGGSDDAATDAGSD